MISDKQQTVLSQLFYSDQEGAVFFFIIKMITEEK